MDSVVEVENPPKVQAAPAAVSQALPDEQDFNQRYGALVRALIREEIERYLRSAAD
jgi:hypothetical protein